MKLNNADRNKVFAAVHWMKNHPTLMRKTKQNKSLESMAYRLCVGSVKCSPKQFTIALLVYNKEVKNSKRKENHD